ncbi:hypothetical protein PROVRETT_10137, partial [Providencia rettgeri DSM 1131]
MVSKIVVNHLSGAILKNTISALNKYDAYLAWCVEPDDILL